MKLYTKIIGTGSCIPPRKVENSHFLTYDFFDPSTCKKFDRPNEEIVTKFQEITNIKERRWLTEEQTCSDLAKESVAKACEDAGISPETLDFIIVANNFGDVKADKPGIDTMPALANRVKRKLGIKNPKTICHDLISGCPGWTQAMIVANAYITSKTYKRGAVVGADALSRVSDPHDRDSMIFADGAGAAIVEGIESNEPVGFLAQASRSDCDPYADLLVMGESLNPDYERNETFIKMAGHRLYVYALKHAPGVVKESIENAGLQLADIKKVIIHQANEKMDEAILSGVFRLFGEKEIPEGIMPMSIERLGNSSTATVPTLLDLIMKGKMEGQEINKGEYIILCSIGAGMNINSIVYKWC